MIDYVLLVWGMIALITALFVYAMLLARKVSSLKKDELENLEQQKEGVKKE
jgi:beta-lactamase regulating signal transducer with metallopeptidase domain